ncbi:HK97 family phage prohead protease [Roseicella sp. DB1501]|uniref:HK97 family phage prohead protease n=1 Tax=Roseicella sp. DB1501 TaxID=2730925 RepID=UPI001490D60E|nr:HK97 family phage prohead protease [Roseicella sp. DB1501]NOG69803.1 peptidase [Roseicella sp. DB1501]
MNIDITHFKALAADGRSMTDIVVRSGPLPSPAEVLGDRTARFTISTEREDRDGDTISVKGWQTQDFERNPVVLWGHDQGSLPIGRVTQIGVEGRSLKATVEFVPADVPIAGQMAEAVFRMVQSGFLHATSVGFKPREWDLSDRKGGSVDFKRQELLELSIVSVPSNADCIAEPARKSVEAIEDKSDSNAVTSPEAAEGQVAKAAAAKARRARALRLIMLGN